MSWGKAILVAVLITLALTLAAAILSLTLGLVPAADSMELVPVAAALFIRADAILAFAAIGWILLDHPGRGIGYRELGMPR